MYTCKYAEMLLYAALLMPRPQMILKVILWFLWYSQTTLQDGGRYRCCRCRSAWPYTRIYTHSAGSLAHTPPPIFPVPDDMTVYLILHTLTLQTVAHTLLHPCFELLIEAGLQLLVRGRDLHRVKCCVKHEA